MNCLVEKIKNIGKKEPEDEIASSLRSVSMPPYLEYKAGAFDVMAKGMWTGAIAFRELILKKDKIREIYNSFFRRNESQVTFPLGTCYGPSGKGPGKEFDLEVYRTNSSNKVYFKLKEPGQFTQLIGSITNTKK